MLANAIIVCIKIYYHDLENLVTCAAIAKDLSGYWNELLSESGTLENTVVEIDGNNL